MAEDGTVHAFQLVVDQQTCRCLPCSLCKKYNDFIVLWNYFSFLKLHQQQDHCSSLRSSHHYHFYYLLVHLLNNYFYQMVAMCMQCLLMNLLTCFEMEDPNKTWRIIVIW